MPTMTQKPQPKPKPKLDHGGPRKGAGRKARYGEKTRVLQVRIPESAMDRIDELAAEQSLDRAGVIAALVAKSA